METRSRQHLGRWGLVLAGVGWACAAYLTWAHGARVTELLRTPPVEGLEPGETARRVRAGFVALAGIAVGLLSGVFGLLLWLVGVLLAGGEAPLEGAARRRALLAALLALGAVTAAAAWALVASRGAV